MLAPGGAGLTGRLRLFGRGRAQGSRHALRREQSRLRLCMLMRGDLNLLILDEPTNHLDLASREWMEDALRGILGDPALRLARQVLHREIRLIRIWSLKTAS